MKKVIRLTESDLVRIVKRVINEQSPLDKVKNLFNGDSGVLNRQKVEKMGYSLTPGTFLDEKKSLYDSGVSVVGQTNSSANMELQKKLSSKGINIRDGVIFSKVLPNKSVEVKFYKFNV